MVLPINRCTSTPTGRVSVRRGWFGRPVLQIELRRDYSHPFDFRKPPAIESSRLVWADARMDDVTPRQIFEWRTDERVTPRSVELSLAEPTKA